MLREWSTAPVLDIRDFLAGLIFNMLIGNADAHGKNYSLLYGQSERRVAPFYDLVCTLAWPELSTTPAMKIGQCDSLDAIAPAHWHEMTQEARLGWPLVRERIVDLCRAVLGELPKPDLRQATGNDAMFERVAGIIEKRTASMLQSLS